jgi:hypothetical protein
MQTGWVTSHTRSHTVTRRTLRSTVAAACLAVLAGLLIPAGSAQSASTTNPQRLPKGVIVGFNAKGTVDSEAQLAAVDKVFSTLDRNAVSKWVIRITGGTRSQSDFPSTWTDAQIDGWIAIQKKFGFRYVYVVNGNDSPESQLAFITKWRDRGAKFEFIEMMNEYYLARYRNGDTSFDEVTKVVTADSYVNEILPTYLPFIEKLGLPIYVILAPSRQEGSSANLKAWNDVVVKALSGPLASRKLGVTVHLYRKPNQTLDYTQISKLRSQLPKGTRIALTEVGVTDSPNESVHAAETKKHLLLLGAQLKPGDYLLEQILFKPEENSLEGSIGPSGLTLKGKAVIDLYTAPRR